MSLSRVPRRVWLVASLSGLGLILLVADRSSVFRSRTVPMTFPPPNPMERQKDASKFTKIPFSGPDFPDSPGHVGKPEPTSHIHPETPFPVPDHSYPVKLDTALRNMTENPSSHKQQSGPVAFDLADPLRGYVGVPDDSKQLDLHCGVCALVSSSGQLLYYKAGNEIEQADCVIRMNEAPAIGFEEHVGRKTTLRVMCFKSIYLVPDKTTLFSDAGNSTLLGWGPPRDMDTAKGKAYRKLERLQASYPELEVYKLTEDRIQYADRVFETETGLPRKKSGAWLSTGWFTMLVAMDICDVIKVYGMISEDYCRTHPADQTLYHYFSGPGSLTECGYYRSQQNSRHGGHRLVTEKTVFARWARHNNITFLYPSWDP